MKAFLLLNPGTSRERAILRRILRWSTDDIHETTDVERVECSADLLEVKGCEDEFEVKSLDHWSRRIGTVDDCRDCDFWQAAGTGLHLRPDRSDHSLQRGSSPKTCRS